MIRRLIHQEERLLIFGIIFLMLVYFVLATPAMNDDGFHYEGFAESLAKGKLDFKSFYGFQGLSFFAVPIFWLTGSHNSIIITSAIFSLLSIPLVYLIGKEFYGNSRAGVYFLILFLLTPYPYTTMMRGFQEAALLFFILLIIYGSLNRKLWTPVAWAIGGIVKPFALVLLPLFVKDFLPTPTFSLSSLRLNLPKLRFNLKVVWVIMAGIIGVVYLSANYYQTGHLVNNAAINSYQGNFDINNPPSLTESFVPSIKGFLRVGANLFLHFRKIMISPVVIILGVFSLLFNKKLKLRKEIILAVIVNLLLVGSLTFSFSKYLLPMTTLFALVSVSYFLKHKWLMVLVFIDSFFVFLPIWNYFGSDFWSNIYLYLIPFWLAIILFGHESRLEVSLAIKSRVRRALARLPLTG